MQNFFGVTIALICVVTLTIVGGYFVHQKIVKNELQFQTFQTYVQCVELNAKEQCKFVLK
jgi:putative Ca2+/H+ antiporter (TMEM165/GDT1 family)